MTSAPTIPYTQYLDLFDRHERAALDALGRLAPDVPVTPHRQDALSHAGEHLATLEVWAWLLEHPESDWRAYDGRPSATAHVDVLAAIARERDRLTRLLVDVGPDLALDYFGRPGTAYDVARLLAHEAISVAVAAGDAGGAPMGPLHPDVAADWVDRALEHWSEPDADVDWHPASAQLVTTDTPRSWWVRFGQDREGLGGAIAPGSAGDAALVLSGPADGLVRWLEGYAVGSLEMAGDGATLRTLRAALGHRVEQEPRRPWWRRR